MTYVLRIRCRVLGFWATNKNKRNGENGESQATRCFSSNPQLVADDAHQT